MKPWFIVKRYGVGLSPHGFGWAVTALFVLLLVAAVIALKRTGNTGLIAPAILGLAAVFFVIMTLTSDHKPWRWRWGRNDET